VLVSLIRVILLLFFQGKSLKFTCRGRAKVKSSLYACGIRAGCLLVQGSKFKVQGYMLKDNHLNTQYSVLNTNFSWFLSPGSCSNISNLNTNFLLDRFMVLSQFLTQKFRQNQIL
jgi:hypothetical protein